MSDDWGLLDKDGAAEPICQECETPVEWIVCEACDGDGEYECYEEDPLWYDPDDTKPCPQCAGIGGWYICPYCISQGVTEGQWI